MTTIDVRITPVPGRIDGVVISTILLKSLTQKAKANSDNHRHVWLANKVNELLPRFHRRTLWQRLLGRNGPTYAEARQNAEDFILDDARRHVWNHPYPREHKHQEIQSLYNIAHNIDFIPDYVISTFQYNVLLEAAGGNL